MSFALKIIGGACVLIAAAAMARLYDAFSKRRLSECESFISLLEHIRSEISCFLSPKERIFRGYEDENLERVGFLPLVREGEDMGDAFDKISQRLLVGKSGLDILASFFSGLGRGYKDGAMALGERCIAEFRKYYESLKDESEKNVKLFRTVIIGLGLGILILLL